MTSSHPPQNNPGSNVPPASLFPLLQQATNSRLQMNSASGRSNNDQNGDRSVISGCKNSPLPQPSRQMPNMPGNNNREGNDSLSLALFGNLAKLVDLQGIMGNNSNNNGGRLGSNNNNNYGLGNAQSIEQQLRSLGLPVSQQQINALLSSSGGQHKMGQRSASSSLTQAMQSGGDSGEDNMSAKFSFSSRNRIGDSASMQSNSVNTQTRVAVVPCRARGMPMEHNFQTAYFEIPEHIKHGDGLICSFPQCRNRGVKFLYCAYCKDPVAKRNFRDRHTHNDQAASKKVNKQTNNTPQPQSVAKSTTKNKATHEVSEGTGSNTGSGSSSGILAVAPKHHHNKKRSAVNMTNTSSDDASRSKLARMDDERKDAWILLLGERPNTDQSDDMSAWLMKVMAVSDLKKPTTEALAKVKGGTPKSNSPEPGSSGSSNEDSNESSPTDESSPTESSSSNGAVKGAKKMASSAPTSSNDASNEENESSNDSSSSDNQDDMDIKEIWIRDESSDEQPSLRTVRAAAKSPAENTTGISASNTIPQQLLRYSFSMNALQGLVVRDRHAPIECSYHTRGKDQDLTLVLL
eukprot:CAMPEP_0176198616 /NCGR_PEP_ID=MMETSP0121_2-20121125/8143_1 /TAXON_ID=160619 /ORGANISM="Kryptoperidinium foliaceum, Strain CCMP 1326" /LENGTH=575 /DNA_ID=CAMNT_0017537469 /DNA_START=36 /DNA_END=1764 /DNA_ORIENTATION=+